MSKTYAACHAQNVPPLVYIYDRDDNLLFDAHDLTGQISNLQYSSMIPGGYENCTFTLPLTPNKRPLMRQAFRLVVRCGLMTAWDGRIEDMARTTGEGGTLHVTAYGGWAHLRQRRITITAGATETAQGLIKRALNDAPLISQNLADIDDPGLALDSMAWTRKDMQEVIKDVAQLGDDQTPPNEYHFNVWHTDAVPTSQTYSDTIDASARDAHDQASEGDNSYTSTVVRVGAAASNFYTAGFIFPALGFERYTNILTAHMHLISGGELGTAEPVNMTIYCEASATPADFDSSWPDTRTRTVSYETWIYTDNWPAAGTNIQTDDFADVVQEVVNLPGWNTGSKLCVLIVGEDQTPNDTRKQIKSYDDAASVAAQLDITTGAKTGMSMAFHPEFIVHPTICASNVDYVIYADDVEGGLELIPSTEKLANQVTAKYGGSNYTAAATDSISQDLYDVRENNPGELDAGDTAGSTVAVNLRDAYLEQYKYPVWKANDITIRRLRNRHGQFVNPAVVRAGCIVRLADFPTFDSTDTERSFFIVRTRYDAESGQLTLSPEMQRDTIEMQLAAVRRESEA